MPAVIGIKTGSPGVQTLVPVKMKMEIWIEL